MAPYTVLSADLAKLVEQYFQAYVFFLEKILDGLPRLLNIDQQNLKRFSLITLLQLFK